MLGNLFQFGGNSDGQKYLYKELGRGNREINRMIEGIPQLSTKLYETVRTLADQNIKLISDEYCVDTGKPDIFRELDPDRLKKIDLELINYMFYHLGRQLEKLLESHPKSIAFLHGIYLELRKVFFIPEEHFQRYTNLKGKPAEPEAVDKKFTIALAGLITGRPDINLASKFQQLAPVIEKACRMLIDIHLLKPRQ